MDNDEGFRSGTATPRSQVTAATPVRLTPHDIFRPTIDGTPSFTPRTFHSGSGTPMSQRQVSRTPMSSNSLTSQRIVTPVGALPRGDVGRTARIPAVRNAAPPTPTRETILNYRGAEEEFSDAEDDQQPHHVALEPDDVLANLHDTVIWGTNIAVDSTMRVFDAFLRDFREPGAAEPHYPRELLILYRSGRWVLNLNCDHLKHHITTRKFHRDLVDYPHEMIPLMDRVVQRLYAEVVAIDGGEADESARKIQVRMFNLKPQSSMRRLDPEDIDKLISIKGMVIRCSNIIPDLKQAFFRCFVCGHSVDVMIDRGRIEEPKKCDACQKVGAMELVHNRCMFTDKQMIRLQETPDEIPEGETPYTLTLLAYDDLVDTVRPGDRIEVTGIFRAIPRRENPHMRTISSIFKTYLDAIHFRRANTAEDKMVTNDSVANPAAALNQQSGNDGLDDVSAVDKQFTATRVESFRAFVNAGNVYDRLVRSFAPSVWEMDDVKRGLLCLLFGGTIRRNRKKRSAASRKRKSAGGGGSSGVTKVGRASSSSEEEEVEGEDEMEALMRREQECADEQLDEEPEPEDEEDEEGDEKDPAEEDESLSVHQRGDINILLCGDPGTSKSQLLSYVHKITPRGIYTSGKGSSAVGLTASVVRDPETRDMVLESGALVLSDNGICCIDEFDKMSDATRAILHEAMEQQTVSITKAGIIATLNARTSIVASANPVESRYNPRLSVVENIKLPPTLLSRFDLIYLVLDKPDEQSDRRLATHLVSLYHTAEEERVPPTEAQLAAAIRNPREVVDQQFLKDFIAYARNNVFPDISHDAEEELVQSYLEMRALGGRGLKTITATPRQLESLIRISQSLAKMRLSSEVLVSDVREATRLMKVATQTAATDPRTGAIDMDALTTGRSAVDRDLVQRLAEQMRELFGTPAYLGKSTTVGNIRMKVIEEMRAVSGGGNGRYGGSDVNVSQDMVEAAIAELQSEGFVNFNSNTHYVTFLRG